MTENDHSPVIGTTTTYKRQMITMITAAVLVIAVVLCVVFFWLRINADARMALREAKDVRIAMKMKAIEVYGLGGTVYNPSTFSGMNKSTEESVLKMANADGSIILQSWDDDLREPNAFTYQKDRYIVIFSKDESGGLSWTVSYTFKVMEYSDIG